MKTFNQFLLEMDYPSNNDPTQSFGTNQTPSPTQSPAPEGQQNDQKLRLARTLLGKIAAGVAGGDPLKGREAAIGTTWASYGAVARYGVTPEEWTQAKRMGILVQDPDNGGFSLNHSMFLGRR